MKGEKIRVPIQVRVPIISDKQNCCPCEEPFGYIYLVTNKVNGHMYIGKHEFHHPWLDKSYKGSGEALQRAYKKYRENNFEIIILEWTDKNNDELNRLEKYWIDVFGAFKFPFHYNLTEGGDGASGESNYMYGNHMWAGSNNPMYGVHRKHTNKEKNHHSRVMKEVHKNNPELAINQSNMMYQKFRQPGYKEQVSTKVHEYYIQHPEKRDLLRETSRKSALERWSGYWGEEHKKLLSDKNSGERNSQAKKVVRLNDSGEAIKVYGYLKQVEEDGFCPTVVSLCCKNKYKYHGKYENYHWGFLNE